MSELAYTRATDDFIMDVRANPGADIHELTLEYVIDMGAYYIFADVDAATCMEWVADAPQEFLDEWRALARGVQLFDDSADAYVYLRWAYWTRTS